MLIVVCFHRFIAKEEVARRKQTPGRKTVRVLTAAGAVVALIAMFVFAYSAWTPSVDKGERRTANAGARRDVARATTPATASRATPAKTATTAKTKTPARDSSRTADTGLQRASTASEPAPATVTITGCLARSDNEFRLNNTSGTDAPKSRSWKSGFLTKRAASVAIVPVAQELPLSSHVGQRISVTGTLVDREMRVRSVRRVSTSCENAPRARA